MVSACRLVEVMFILAVLIIEWCLQNKVYLNICVLSSLWCLFLAVIANERAQAEAQREREELLIAIEENKRLEKEAAAKRHREGLMHQNDLLGQIDYNRRQLQKVCFIFICLCSVPNGTAAGSGPKKIKDSPTSQAVPKILVLKKWHCLVPHWLRFPFFLTHLHD